MHSLVFGASSFVFMLLFYFFPDYHSSLGRFLAHVADPKDPTVAKGDAEHPTLDTQWTIEAQADGTWAFKSRQGFYLTGSGEKVSVVNGLTDGGKWVVHLAMHPQ